MRLLKLITIFCILVTGAKSQTNVYRDTIAVFENGTKLLSAWA